MKKGILFLVLSALSFATMSALVRLSDDFGPLVPAFQKSFFRNVVAAGIALWVFARRGTRTGRLPRGAGEWTALAARAVCGTVGLVANFYALSRIPVGEAFSLNKTAPFFTLVFSWMLLGERMSVRQTACVLGAFLGAMFVVKPDLGGVFGSGAAGWIGLLSGVGAGAAYAFLHRLGRAGVDGPFIVLVFSSFSCLSCVPFFAADPVPMTAAQWAALLGAGAAAACGQFAITAAYRCAEPRQIAIYDYTGILFASAYGFLLFGQVPDLWSFLGFALIAAMAFLLHAVRP